MENTSGVLGINLEIVLCKIGYECDRDRGALAQSGVKARDYVAYFNGGLVGWARKRIDLVRKLWEDKSNWSLIFQVKYPKLAGIKRIYVRRC